MFARLAPCRRAVTHRARPSLATASRAMSTHPYADLSGKVVVVGGAGNPPDEEHGMGAITSLAFARLGATVVSVSNVAENCETVTAAIKAEGHTGTSFTADCTAYEEVAALRDHVLAEHGRVDVVVNAGIHDALPNGFGKMTPEKWAANMDINCNAHYNLIHAFLPTFQEQQSGNILHYTTFGSACALGMGNQRHGYFAGKAAAAVLTRRIGIENARKGIRANVISIGYASGPLVTRAVNNAGADMAKVSAGRDANVPRGYQIVPDEIARTAVFLASDASSGINAAEIFADGGNHCTTYGP